MSTLQCGDVAPLFSLENQHEVTVALKDYRGKKNVVVYFYPRASTPGCTVQACGIRDYKKEFAACDTVVLAISPDTVKKIQNFVLKQALNFDLLSDVEHEVADDYGVWALKKNYGKEYMGIVRSTFIVGKDGKIKHVMNKVKTKTHHDDVLQFIQANLCN
jgi:peroxiredoxin Q/BCP